MSLFVARYLDILLPSLISGLKTVVRNLTIAYYAELSRLHHSEGFG